MERDMNENDNAMQPDDARLQERLSSYFNAKFGQPRQSEHVWNSIANNLGEQEGQASVEFARSLNGLYGTPQDQIQKSAIATREAGVPATSIRGTEKRKLARWGGLWSPALAAGLVLAIIAIIVAFLSISANVPQINSAATPTAVPSPAPGSGEIPLQNPGFEDGFFKWYTSGSDGYSVNVDKSVAHSGSTSISIASTSSIFSFRPISQALDPVTFIGERLRFTGYIKTKGVVGGAVLWMRVDARQEEGQPWGRVLSFDNMDDRAPSGTTDWTRYEIVLDVPEGAVNIYVGAFLQGGGQMWVDDLRLERVGKDVAATRDMTQSQLQNTGFEDGTRWWGLSGNYGVKGVDSVVVHSGKTSARLEQTTANYKNLAGYAQSIAAGEYAGKRVQFSAYLKTENVQERAGLWLDVGNEITIPIVKDHMELRPVYGTTDWTLYKVVVDVPANGAFLTMGAELSGAGRIWVDDAKLEVVGSGVPTTNLPVETTLVNASFESGLQPGWNLMSSRPAVFEAGVGKAQANTGAQGAFLRVVGEKTTYSGSLQQTFSADQYRGKKIKISLYINADQVKDTSNMWAEINDALHLGDPSLLGESYIWAGEDGYAHGWVERTITLTVPETAESITLGMKLSGAGEVWVDDMKITILDDNTPTP